MTFSKGQRYYQKMSKKNHRPTANETPVHALIMARYGNVSAFATRIGINRRHLYNVLARTARPSIDLASKFAYNLGLTLDEFNKLLGPPLEPAATTTALKKKKKKRAAA